MDSVKIEKLQLGFSEYPTNDWSTGIYFCGCSNGCMGCHNEHLWDSAGTLYTMESLIEELDKQAFINKTKSVTLLGGDPLYVDNIDFVSDFVCKVYEGYNVCLYTGCNLEDVVSRKFPLRYLRYLKTGRYDKTKYQQSKKTNTQLFLGSTNQEMYKVTSAGRITLISQNGIVQLQ